MSLTAKNIFLLILMLASVAASFVLKPKVELLGDSPAPNLELLIPVAFGDWTQVSDPGNQIINPQQRETLQEIYSQVYSKTFINSNGNRIMLSIAYGSRQSKTLQVHRPESCYVAQGFQISSTVKDQIFLNKKMIPIMRVDTKLGNRHEPLSYWVRIGNKLVIGNYQQSLARLVIGLSGRMPDGILVRASSISDDSKFAYKLQDNFLESLYYALPDTSKQFLVGNDSNL